MKHKEPLLVLSYYFPPCNLTPSERVYSWAKYLKNSAYYPIIVTRNWDTKITNSTTDAYSSSGDSLKIEKHDGYEVHYLPYRSSLKDKIFLKLNGGPAYLIYLGVAFFYNLLQLMFLKFSPFYSFYPYAKKILDSELGIKKMVVSAAPFELFGIAYKLHKNANIKWIADYRDDWSTSSLHTNSWMKRIVNLFNAYYEKKWLKGCSVFTTVSGFYVEKIGRAIGNKGLEMTNGYLPENYLDKYDMYDDFTITYVGSIYETQPIELFLKGVISYIQNNESDIRLKVIFVGIGNEPRIRNRIQRNITGFEKYFSFTGRVEKKTAIEIQAKSHLLLACSHYNLKGIPGSKLYEYIALRKPVVVYPTDNDIIERTLSETKQGLICHTEKELLHHLGVYYEQFQNNYRNTNQSFNEEAIRKYSREVQTQVLIQALDNLG